MPQSREQFLLTRRRIQTVMEYMVEHLDQEHITLGTLAEVASLSRCHFERLYTLKVNETPMATMRRLRLARAREQLEAGTARSVSDLAIQSGYGSIAAFSRAFSRSFGESPTRVSRITTRNQAPQLDIVELPATPVVRLPFTGRAAEVFHAGDELSWLVSRSGPRNWRHWVVHPDGWIDPAHEPDAWVRMWHCVPTATANTSRIAGTERGYLPGGHFACFRFIGKHYANMPQLRQRIAAETDWQASDGPMLRHFPQATHFTAPTERITCLYLPVSARQTSTSRSVAKPDMPSQHGNCDQILAGAKR